MMDRDLFLPDALQVAPRLLGALFSVDSPEGTVSLRITEVEAYMGLGSASPYDPGSHSRDRRTERNSSMLLSPGHAYVYFSYGMHFAFNFVCSPAGIASGVLLRAGEVVEGAELARTRRRAWRTGTDIKDAQLARGPGNAAQALGITHTEHDGRDLYAAPFRLSDPPQPPAQISTGLRVGVAGMAGGPEFPWRFWLPGEPSVSAFRRGPNAPSPAGGSSR